MQRSEGEDGAARSQDQRMARQQGSDQLTVRERWKIKDKGRGQKLKEFFCPIQESGTSSSRQRRITGGLRTGSSVKGMLYLFKKIFNFVLEYSQLTVL